MKLKQNRSETYTEYYYEHKIIYEQKKNYKINPSLVLITHFCAQPSQKFSGIFFEILIKGSTSSNFSTIEQSVLDYPRKATKSMEMQSGGKVLEPERRKNWLHFEVLFLGTQFTDSYSLFTNRKIETYGYVKQK